MEYTLPKSVTHYFTVENIKIFITGENLLTITPNNGYDPEIVGTVDSYKSTLFSKSIDKGVYPPSRTILCGIHLTL